jgi:hypothetical protein
MLNVYALFEVRNNSSSKSLTSLFYSLLHCQIRHENEVAAMSWDERVRKRCKNFFVRGDATAGETKPSDEESRSGKAVQYRLAATRRAKKKTMWGFVTSCGGLFGSSRGKAGTAVGINPNQKLALYLHWMFRVNFIFLFGVMCTMFFAFAVCEDWWGRVRFREHCFRGCLYPQLDHIFDRWLRQLGKPIRRLLWHCSAHVSTISLVSRYRLTNVHSIPFHCIVLYCLIKGSRPGTSE